MKRQANDQSRDELLKTVKERDALASALEQANHVIAINGLNEKECLTEIARLESALASLSALLAEAGEALRPFSKMNFSFDGYSFEMAQIFLSREYLGTVRSTSDHEKLARLAERAASTLASIQSALRDASPTTGKPE